MRVRAILAILAAGSLALAGCAAAPADDGRPLVVASTSVYGDIVSRIGGGAIEVHALIDNPAQDPHSYEVTARDRLMLERADLVVANGGGYDGFVDVVLDAIDAPPTILHAVDFADLDEHAELEQAGEHPEHEHDDEHGEHEHGDEHTHDHSVNEHVWYDLAVIDALAVALAHELDELAPAAAASIEANASELRDELHALADRAAELAADAHHARAIVTEPAPGYLLAAVGVQDVTPEGFAQTIEEGGDIPPALLAEVLAAIDGGDIALLAYNAQTAGHETERVRRAAEAAGVPVVDVAETLPEGDDYVGWMATNLDALEEALR